jgi:hypothetical protein
MKTNRATEQAKMPKGLIKGRISDLPKCIWVLTFLDRKNVEHFIGSFFSHEEAEQHVTEGLGRKRVSWRWNICGYEPACLAVVHKEAGQWLLA